MAKQLHKKFTDEQIKELIERYLKKEIERKYIQEILGIKQTRFFTLVKDYRNNLEQSSVKYVRKSKNRIPLYPMSNGCIRSQILVHILYVLPIFDKGSFWCIIYTGGNIYEEVKYNHT